MYPIIDYQNVSCGPDQDTFEKLLLMTNEAVKYHYYSSKFCSASQELSTVASQPEGTGFKPQADLDPFCVKFPKYLGRVKDRGGISAQKC